MGHGRLRSESAERCGGVRAMSRRRLPVSPAEAKTGGHAVVGETVFRGSPWPPGRGWPAQAAAFWDSLSDLLDEYELLPINQAAHRLASLLHEYRGLWPLIKSDAEVDPERGKALAAALAKRREFLRPGADL